MHVDITKYCLHNFLMTQDTEQAANKWCEVELSLSVDNWVSHIELWASSNFLTWNSESALTSENPTSEV